MNTYFALFLIATFSSLVLTPLLRRVCEKFKLLDLPAAGRKTHNKPVPRLGGVALYLSCIIALSTLPLVDNLLTQTLRQHTFQALIILIPATLVLLLGIYDDLRGTNATIKFAALGFVAILFYVMGGRIEALSIPFVGTVQLPSTPSFLFTVFWLVGIANAFNLIDGVDGLASGAALFSSLVIMLASLSQGAALTIVVTLVLCGALAGFLRYNFNPASIFLGDSGALFVGFTLAALSVLGTQKATTAVAVAIPALAFGLPVVDTGVTMARRLISGKPLFEGDTEHIHHMLLARGWSQRRVALALYGVCAGFGLVAMLFARTGSHTTGFVLFVVGVVVLIAVGQLRYHEVDELRAGVKRTVSDRRVRVANNIRIRRASKALARAGDAREVVDALSLVLNSNEFEYVRMQLGRAKHSPGNESGLLGSMSQAGPEPEISNGQINWSWRRPGLDGDEIKSEAYWCLRLPLSTGQGDWGWLNLYRAFDADPLLLDLNYLSGLFRSELSEAAERILNTASSETSKVGELRLAASSGKVAG